MANILIYPFINPVQLFDPAIIEDDRYRSRDFIDYDLLETILPWQQSVGFCQQWQKSDTISLQLQTNVGPVNFKLRNGDGGLVDTLLFTQGAESVNTPGLYIHEVSVPLTDYPEGCYYAEVTFGASPVVFTLRTGTFEIHVTVANSLLLEYQHYEFREEMIFETGVLYQIRLMATNRYLKTAAKSTTYEDQVLNMTALRSVAFRTWKLMIGRAAGIPDWMADKIGRIIGCSTFMIDGKSFTKPEGSELEPNEADNYPMRGWVVELRERFNRASREYENQIPLDAYIAAMVNVDSKGFGNSNAGSQTAITDVN